MKDLNTYFFLNIIFKLFLDENIIDDFNVVSTYILY